MTTRPRPPIAVVGASALFPGSLDETGFWRDILAGRDLIRDVPPTHWLREDYFDADPTAPDKTYATRGAFLDPIAFDALGFGIPPNIVPATDTAQLLALIVAQRVLDDATRGQFSKVARDKVSVILGVTSGQELLSSMASRLQRPVWVKSLREAGLPESKVQEVCDRIAGHYVPWQENTFPGLLGNVVAGRIANRFDTGGTNCVTDAACASSLSALSMAVNELVLGQSDLVITGGVDTLNDIFMYMCFAKTQALSRTGDCRPFSDEADGTLLGEGLAMLALKRLEDAEAAGDRIYAVIRGVGSSSDGRAKSVYAPRPEGQAQAINRAYESAGYGPQTVELLEAHGTGTKAGDAAEAEGLKLAFEAAGRKDRQWCALGSVKSQIGHTKAAAGAAGLFKAIFSLLHGTLPPTIKVARPNPKLDLAQSPFYLNTQARPWVRGSDHPRRAGVSSFGFGGSNFHVTLEEYRGAGQRALRRRTAPAELVTFGAATPEALLATLRGLQIGEPGFLRWLSRDSQEKLDRGAAARLAIVATDEADLRAKLAAAVKALEANPTKAFSAPGVHYGSAPREGKLGFLFPGQGSQYVGMGADLAMGWAEALAAWDVAADLVRADGVPLHEVVFPRPAFTDEERAAQAKRLQRTEWAQPAIGAASLAQLRLLARLGLRPDAAAGHSFGELTALLAAGAIDEASFLRAARRRGELMAEAARAPGAMTAALAPAAEVQAALAEVPGAAIANFNAPKQSVVSGAIEAIERAEAAFQGRGIRFQRLDVATAFHSPIVASAQEPFAAFLESVPFRAPALPVPSNAEAAPYPADPASIRRLLTAQLARPVRFVEQIESLYAAGVRTFVEVGPVNVLTGLVERILEGRPFTAVALDAKGKHGVAALHEGLARLWAAGQAMDFAALWADHHRYEDPRALKKPAVALPIAGANYAKPYPPPEGARALPPPNPEAPPPAALQASAPAAPLANGGWLDAYQQAQRETLEAHTAWQKSMTDTHTAFLQAMERSFQAAMGGAVDLPAMPLPAPVAVPVAAAAPLPQPVVAAPPPPPEPKQAQKIDLKALLLEVVSVKTGYPPEMLNLDLGLESDLGIDSIKRVEILSAMRERVPDLPEVKPAEMASLKTLGAIVAYLGERTGGGATGAAPQAAAQAPPSADLKALLLEVVSAKTGYPAEMLNLDLGLESDLGIDSIKRVEILSAMRERVPDLPEVKPAQMAGLKTLGAIVAFLQQGGPADAAPSAPEPAPTPAAPAAVVQRFVVEAVEKQPCGLGLRGLGRSRSVVVTPDGAGVDRALVALLRERGIDAVASATVPAESDGVIFLGGLSESDPAAVVREAFHAARAVASRFASSGGVFVTVQDTGGDFGLSGSERAWVGGLAGLAKTAAVEWPGAAVKAIDLERAGRPAPALAAAIFAELLEGGGDREVGLRAQGARRVLTTVARPAAVGSLPWDRESVVVATGGARGVTASCLLALAIRQPSCRFVLLGRTALVEEPAGCEAARDDAALKKVLLEAAKAQGRTPSLAEIARQSKAILAAREATGTLEALRAAGAEARYVAVDTRDGAALAAALDEVRKAWGPITAIVHGAGVLADKRIADKTDEAFDAVYDTKIAGLQALLAATATDPVRAICLFSSVAARFGNEGQCDYAAANEVLNKVAALEAKRRGGACRVKSIGWGPWDGGMVDAGLRARFAAMGASLLPLEDGARAFVEELCDGGPAEVLIGSQLPAARADEVAFAVAVNHASHPFLTDHRIDDVPVLPVVQVLEWFVRAARAAAPDLELLACRDLKVLRGVRLDRFQDGGHWLTVRCHRAAESQLDLELRGADGALHYAMKADLGANALLGHAPPPPPALTERYERAIYGQELFHGPLFQVVREVAGVSEEGLVGTLTGTRERGWQGRWETDAAALDGGLQLALLWSGHVLGGHTLPTSIGAVRAYRPGAAEGPLRCILRGRRTGDARATSDLAFVAADGELVFEMDGVETHRRPDPKRGA